MSGPGAAPVRLTTPPSRQITLLSARRVSHSLRVERGILRGLLSCGSHSGFHDTRRSVSMSITTGTSPIRSKALFTIVGGMVLINPGLLSGAGTGSAGRGAAGSRGYRPSRQSQGFDGHEARRDRRGRRHQCRGHRQVSGHESERGAAANHGRLDRPPQRRRRSGDRARLRPAVQHGDAQWPPDAGSRCLRQRRPAPAVAYSEIRARSISRTWPPRRSALSRSTRPAARISPLVASVRRSTCAPHGRSTTTRWC